MTKKTLPALGVFFGANVPDYCAKLWYNKY